MNMRATPPSGGGGGGGGFERLISEADRIEKWVRRYQWLTVANVAVFGINALLTLALIVLRLWVAPV